MELIEEYAFIGRRFQHTKITGFASSSLALLLKCGKTFSALLLFLDQEKGPQHSSLLLLLLHFSEQRNA